jgi:hypothetical protein
LSLEPADPVEAVALEVGEAGFGVVVDRIRGEERPGSLAVHAGHPVQRCPADGRGDGSGGDPVGVPWLVGGPEMPKPGGEGMTTWKGVGRVGGLLRGSISSRNSNCIAPGLVEALIPEG